MGGPMRLTIKGEYPADWKDIAQRVKAEADNRCIRCGHPDGDRRTKAYNIEQHGEDGDYPLSVIGPDLYWRKDYAECDERCSHPKDGKMRALTVHHLDGDKSNCRWWNLLALCQLCHLTIQGKVIPERPFLWEHSDWFKPYAAGFYSYWYAEDSATEREVRAHLDTFLRVGQPWLYAEEGRAWQSR